MSRLALVVLVMLVACSRELDPKACAARIAKLEARIAGFAPPHVVERWVAGYDVPRAPRERTTPIGADGIVVMSRYTEDAMWVRGFGAYADVHPRPRQGEAWIDVARVLIPLASRAPRIPVYVVVPSRDHKMTLLVDMLAKLGTSFDVQLVVGIDEPRVEPAPADAPASVRKTLATLRPPHASEHYSAVQSMIDKAVGSCGGLGRAVSETIVAEGAPNLTSVLDGAKRCGCGTVNVPTLEAVIAALTYKVGQPKLASIPLDLGVSIGTVQQFASSGGPPMPAAEPGLGAPCVSVADCRAPANACRPFDADGTWHPTGRHACTRPCGAGCPKGFRCTREAAITSADQQGIKGQIVSTWCGPIGPR